MCAISFLGSAGAWAYGGECYPEVQIDPRIQGVARAEKAMNRRDYVADAGFVVCMMPHIKTLDAAAGHEALREYRDWQQDR
jgi:hypothetical protein